MPARTKPVPVIPITSNAKANELLVTDSRGTLDGDPYHRGSDVRLMVEVGVATAWSDRSVKLAGYAAGEIEEIRLVVPGADLLTCYQSPQDGKYHDELELPWPDGLPQAVDQLASRIAAGCTTTRRISDP